MITRKHIQLEMNLKNSKKLRVRAKVKWLNFSRCDFQLVFQSNYYSDFTPAASLYHLNSNLPSLQQRLQSWEIIALEATGTAPSPCRVEIPQPGSNQSGLGTEEDSPTTTLPPPTCWQRGLRRAALTSQPVGQPSAAILVPPPLSSTAALCRDVYESLKTTWRSSLTYLYSVAKPTEPQPLHTRELLAYKSLNWLQQIKSTGL